MRHDGGVGRPGEAGVRRRQGQRLAHLNGVDVSELVELHDLIFIGLVAQPHRGVYAADGVAALHLIGDQIVSHAVPAGQAADGAAGEACAGRACAGRAGHGGRAARKRGGSRVGNGQNYLLSDRQLAELAFVSDAVELHDKILISVVIYTMSLADLQYRVSAGKRNGCDLRVGGGGNREHRAQRHKHDDCHQKTYEPLFHRIAPPNRPFPGRNFYLLYLPRRRVPRGSKWNIKAPPRPEWTNRQKSFTLLRSAPR